MHVPLSLEPSIFLGKNISNSKDMRMSFTIQSLAFVPLFVVVVHAALVVITAEDENSPEEAMFPAMFVFGDSLVDNGNNNRLNSLARSNYLPYGIDFDGGQPTGRFSNGKTIVDFIGTSIFIHIRVYVLDDFSCCFSNCNK